MADSLTLTLILILIIISSILLYFTLTKKVCKDIIKYKFIPRTFKETQENPLSIKNLFDDMFTKNSING